MKDAAPWRRYGNGVPSRPAMRVRESSNTVNSRTLEAACTLTGKIEGVETLFDELTPEAASKRFWAGLLANSS